MEENGKLAMQAQLTGRIYAVAHEAMVKHFNERRHMVGTYESRLENMKAQHEGSVYAEAVDNTAAKQETKIAWQIPGQMHPRELQKMIDTERPIVLPNIHMCVTFCVPDELDMARKYLVQPEKMSSQLAAKEAYMELTETNELLKPRPSARQGR